MTRIATNQPAEVAPRHEPWTALVLAWSISRAAAVACGLVDSSTGPAVRLEIQIPAPGRGLDALAASVLDGERRIVVEGPHGLGHWIEDSIRGVWHLDIDGVLKLTVRVSGGSVEALYARTELLARAGVAGGRYEFEGATAR